MSTSIPLNPFSWTAIGPAPINGGQSGGNGPVSGRITAIASIDANVIYIGAAGGGVWKSTNNGTSWSPLTDAQASTNMSSIAIAPSNHNVIYAGTGESSTDVFDSYYGRGLLKSTDAGATWTLITGNAGVNEFNRRSISKIVVDPANANIVYIAVSDFATNGQTGNTGIWKTINGGTTWTNTTNAAGVAVGDAFVDLLMDPTNSQVLYAAAGHPAGNANNGVYKTTNGGTTWALAGNFPSGGNDGRIAITISPNNNQILYAAIANKRGTAGNSLLSVQRTTDGGTTWTTLPGIPNFSGGQAWYDTTISIDPTDATGNTFYAAGNAGSNSVIRVVVNPGPPLTTTVTDISGGANSPHADHHALAIDSTNHLLDAGDGGIWRLNTVSPVAWTDLNTNLQVTTFNSIALDPGNADRVYGGAQDNDVERFTDNLAWTDTQVGDGGFTAVDFNNTNTVYYTTSSGNFPFIERSDNAGSSYSAKTTGINQKASGQLSDNSNFYPVLVMDPGNSSQLFFGTDRVYQTTNRGDNWSNISTPNTNGWTTAANVDAIAASATDSQTIYASANSQIFVTTNDGTSWTQRSIPGFGSGVADLLVDPKSSLVVYAVRNVFNGGAGGHVFRSVDGGQNWTDISGNLPDLPMWSITLDPQTPNRTLYVGTDAGVYVSNDVGATWNLFGSGLPNSIVRDVDFAAGLDILAVGTYGRGAFEIQTTNPNLQICGDQDFPNENDTFRLVRDAANPLLLDVFVNNTTTVPTNQYLLSALQKITIYGGGGVNTLTVDSSNGLINLPLGITFNAGDACPDMIGGPAMGQDGIGTLILTQTNGANSPTVTTDVYSPGPNPGQGTDVITDSNGNTQSIYFTELAPVLDNVPASTVTVNATPADNAINYIQGPGGGIFGAGVTGLVTIDNQESYEFSNKDHLIINALAGSDHINLNDPTTPTGATPGGLKDITVNGQDPTASDTLVVNGIAGTLDNLRYVPTAVGAGNVINDSAAQPQVFFTGVEHLTLVVQQHDGDGVRIEGTTGNDAIEFFHGQTSDSGSFVGTMDQNNATGSGPFTMTPMSYSGASPLANDVDVNFFNPGGTDSFVFNGTANDDTIGIATGEAGGTEFRDTLNGIVVSRLEIFNIASALVRGLTGNDTFNVTVPAGPAAVAIRVEGGDSDASSDTLNYTAPAGAATTIDLGTDTIASTGANPLTFSGIEKLNEISSGAASTLIVQDAIDINLALTYTPTAATAGILTGIGPVVSFTGVGSTFKIAGGAGLGDQVIVQGTNNSDFILVDSPNRNVTVENAAGTDLKTVNLDATIESLQVNGRLGSDTFYVVPALPVATGTGGGATTSAVPTNLLIDIEGGPAPNSVELVVGNFALGAGANPVFTGVSSSLAVTDFVVLNKSLDPNAGVVRIYRTVAGVPTLAARYHLSQRRQRRAARGSGESQHGQSESLDSRSG